MSYGAWGPQQPSSPRGKWYRGQQRSSPFLTLLVYVAIVSSLVVPLWAVLADALAAVDGRPDEAYYDAGFLVTVGVCVVGFIAWRLLVRHRRQRRAKAEPQAEDSPGLKVMKYLMDSPDPYAAVVGVKALEGEGAYLGFSVDTTRFVVVDPQLALMVLGPPRSGKTSSVIVPSVLTAPGAVVSTSTKPDVFQATGEARRYVGEVWVFDPSGSEPVPTWAKTLRWSPVSSAATWDGALLMARAMVNATPVAKASQGDNVHFTERAVALLAPLLHAAALQGATITDVLHWVLDADLAPAGRALEEAGATTASRVLYGIETTPDRERGSILSTTANTLAAYNSSGAQRAATDPNFDAAAVERFVRSKDSIYVTAPADQQALTAPLVVGLLTDIRRATYARARAIAYGREQPQPPVTFALDELANIAPIHDLQAIASEAGGQGLHLIACFQDLSQVRLRWGNEVAEGFFTMFQAKLMFSGIGDARTLEALSTMLGEYDRTVHSYGTSDSSGAQSSSTTNDNFSIQRQRVLSPGEIAKLPDNNALYIHQRGWMLVYLTPGWGGFWLRAIEAAKNHYINQQAEQRRQDHQAPSSP